jgi:hypothetical protein
MNTQELLSRRFIEAEKHRLTGEPPVDGWGSNRHGDKDSLWDITTNTHWERNSPDGMWHIVPPLG